MRVRYVSHELHFHRLINGVRRWIGANPMSNHHRSRHIATSDAAAYSKPTSNGPDPHATSVMALQHLNPTISEEEEGEYQR